MELHPPHPLLQFTPLKSYKFSFKTLYAILHYIHEILVLNKIKYPRPPASEI